MSVMVFAEVASSSVTIGTLLSSAGTSISPSTASPVLKTFLTITLDPENTLTLVQSDLSVRIEPSENNDNANAYAKDLYVTEVDDSARTLGVKFNGAWSGEYNLIVSDATIGRVNMDNDFLTAIGIVTDFSPTQGSKLGGTLLTITGYHFSTDILDNPVKVGMDTYCYVETTSDT